MAQSRSLTSQTKAKEKDTLAFINGFIDDNSFMETDMLVKSVTPLGEATGEGVVSGFGCIGGMQTAIFATDAAVMKGSIGEGAVEKITRIINSAVKTGAPLIAVIDTSALRRGGAHTRRLRKNIRRNGKSIRLGYDGMYSERQ